MKLTVSERRRIHTLATQGMDKSVIANRYKISTSCVDQIMKLTWVNGQVGEVPIKGI